MAKKKKIDEVTTTANIAIPVVPLGMVYRMNPAWNWMKGLKKKKRAPHPLIAWDSLMQKYPNTLLWYV